LLYSTICLSVYKILNVCNIWLNHYYSEISICQTFEKCHMIVYYYIVMGCMPNAELSACHLLKLIQRLKELLLAN